MGEGGIIAIPCRQAGTDGLETHTPQIDELSELPEINLSTNHNLAPLDHPPCPVVSTAGKISLR